MRETFGEKISKIENLTAYGHAEIWQAVLICSSEQFIDAFAALFSEPAKPLPLGFLALALASDSDSANSPPSDTDVRAPRHIVSMSFHRRLTPPRYRHSAHPSGPPGSQCP